RFGAATPADRVELPDTPLVVTTVDAEEAFDWSRPLSRDSRDVSSMREQFRAHRIFERYGIVPTYLVTYPVMTQEDGFLPLQELAASQSCVIGTQLHPWVTPPFEEQVSPFNSFAGNLPRRLEFEKLKILTEAIQDRFAMAPTVYRAGRYGIGPNTAGVLLELGYRVDTSIVPEQNYGHEGGPDFLGASVAPYWLDRSARLLELPLTSGYIGHIADRALALAGRL